MTPDTRALLEAAGMTPADLDAVDIAELDFDLAED